MQRPWRTVTRATLFAMLVYVLLVFRDYGLSWDEEHSAQNGEYAAAWFRTLGHDDRAITGFNQRFYGSAFNLTAHLVRGISPLGSYETGHLLIAIVAWAGLVFTSRLARLAGGDRAGFFALVVLALTPAYAGHAFMNPKDIPLAALFVAASYYLGCAFTELPRPSAATLRRVAVTIGLAAGVRVVGIFLLGYWALAIGAWSTVATLHGRLRSDWREITGWWWKPAFGAWLVMVLCWPYAQLNPLWNPIQALLDNARFQFPGAMLFDGSTVSPQAVRPRYLLTWFSISLPEFYVIGFLAGMLPVITALAAGPAGCARAVAAVVFLLLLALVPPVLAIWWRAVMYDGMRHFLFVLPFLAVLAGWGFASAVDDLPVSRVRRGPLALTRSMIATILVAAGIASMALTAVDMWALHPYEYIYFNRLVAGGQREASTRFETDYWGTSYKEGLDWLRDHYPPRDGPVGVANCSAEFLTEYWLRTSPELSARFVPRSPGTPHSLLLATTRYNCHRRPGKTLHVVTRKGVPLTYVIEQETP